MIGEKKEKYLVALIILAALCLRLWGLGFGLPFALHQDEPIVINHALAYGSGDLNPHFFIIPPLCSYLVFLCYGFYFLIGRLTGLFPGVTDFALEFFKDPTVFFLIARVVLGLVPGTLAVWLVYVLYRKMFQGGGALFAAAIMAVAFLPVVNSHYAYVDSMMVLFVLLTYIFLADLMKKPRAVNYLLSGVFLGLAVSTKYNAAILIVPCLLAHFTAVSEHRREKGSLPFGKYFLLAAAGAVAAFLITNPFAALDWPTFSNDALFRIRTRGMGWTHHMSYSLLEGIGPGLLVWGLAGFLMILMRWRFSRKLVFISFPLIFYMHLVFHSQRFSRYALPLVPFFAIACAYLLFGLLFPLARTRGWKALVVALAFALAAPTAGKSVKADMLFSGEDTRAVSAGWIHENVPPGARIAVDHTSFRPQISQTPEQLTRKYEMADAEKGMKPAKEKKLQYMIQAAEEKRTYSVYFMTGADREVQFLSAVPSIDGDMKTLKGSGIEYVTVNYNDISGGKKYLIDELDDTAVPVAWFSPYYGGKIAPRYDAADMTFLPVGSREIFSRHMTGPVIVIYKMKKRGI